MFACCVSCDSWTPHDVNGIQSKYPCFSDLQGQKLKSQVWIWSRKPQVLVTFMYLRHACHLNNLFVSSGFSNGNTTFSNHSHYKHVKCRYMRSLYVLGIMWCNQPIQRGCCHSAVLQQVAVVRLPVPVGSCHVSPGQILLVPVCSVFGPVVWAGAAGAPDSMIRPKQIIGLKLGSCFLLLPAAGCLPVH